MSSPVIWKKKKRKKKWQNDKLYPYLWRFTTSIYDSTFGKVHHTMIQFYYAVKWEKNPQFVQFCIVCILTWLTSMRPVDPYMITVRKLVELKKDLINKITIKMVESVMYSIFRGRSWQVGIHTNLALFCPWRECFIEAKRQFNKIIFKTTYLPFFSCRVRMRSEPIW